MDSSTIALICGAVGNILFGFKSSFQIIKCFREHSTKGVSKMMLLFDLFGNIACAYYIFSNTGMKLFFQYINYGFATLFIIVLFVMMFLYRSKN